MERQVVVFKINQEEFGVDIKEVREIIKYTEPKQVPDEPDSVLGIINVREQIIPVIDLSIILEIPRKPISSESRVMIIEKDEDIGMLVDSTNEVLRIDEKKIQGPPVAITEKIHHNYIENVAVLTESRIIIILDLLRVFDDINAKRIRDKKDLAVEPQPSLMGVQTVSEIVSETSVVENESLHFDADEALRHAVQDENVHVHNHVDDLIDQAQSSGSVDPVESKPQDTESFMTRINRPQNVAHKLVDQIKQTLNSTPELSEKEQYLQALADKIKDAESRN